MKFTLSFKTPDVLDQLIDEELELEEYEQAKETANKFLKFGEYIDVQFDTETQTATVIGQ